MLEGEVSVFLKSDNESKNSEEKIGQKADDYPKWLNNIPNQIEDRILKIIKKEDKDRSVYEKHLYKDFYVCEKEQEKIENYTRN